MVVPMPIEFEVKINRVHGSLRMTIPKEVARALSIKEGDTALVGLSNSTITVRKKTRPV
jgi:AbrB family looped-hinge helix DNA binding protein